MAGKSLLDVRARVLSVEKGKGCSVRALLSAPRIAEIARPMQFVMVRVRDGRDPFLRRPFSLSHIDAGAGIIGVTWEVVGRGTETMTGWEPGDEVSVLGPLGNGFDLAKAAAGKRPGRLFLIAGGTGLAPMYPLTGAAKDLGWEVSVFYGSRSAGLLLDCSPLRKLGCRVEVCTGDGSEGPRTLVTELARPALSAASPRDLAVSCGPAPMTRALMSLCSELGVTLYVSLEERMACGTGLCKGCAVRMTGAGGYYHVCSDGPVFLSTLVELGSCGARQGVDNP